MSGLAPLPDLRARLAQALRGELEYLGESAGGFLRQAWVRWVLVGLAPVLAVMAILSVAHDPGAEGRLSDAVSGQPVAGALVRATWYVRRETAVADPERMRPLYNVPDSLDVLDRGLADEAVRTDAGGGFRLPSRWLWRGLGGRGPFLRLGFTVGDATNGAEVAAERFKLANDAVVEHAYDEAVVGSPRERTQLLAELKLLPRGRIVNLASDGSVAVTAEGTAGARLFDLDAGGARLVAALTAERLGTNPETVALSPRHIHIFGRGSWRIVGRQSHAVLGGLEGPYTDFVAALDGRPVIARSDGRLDVFEPEMPPRLWSTFDLGESDPEARPDRARFALAAGSLAYLGRSGSVRVWARDGRPPEVLTDSLEPFVAMAAKGPMLYLLSARAVIVTEVVPGERSHTRARVVLPSGFLGEAVAVDDKGLWILGPAGAVRVASTAQGYEEARVAVPFGAPAVKSLEIRNLRAADGRVLVPVLAEVKKVTESGQRTFNPQQSVFQALEVTRIESARLDAFRVLEPGAATRTVSLAPPVVLGFRTGGSLAPMLAAVNGNELWAATAAGGVARVGALP